MEIQIQLYKGSKALFEARVRTRTLSVDENVVYAFGYAPVGPSIPADNFPELGIFWLPKGVFGLSGGLET